MPCESMKITLWFAVWRNNFSRGKSDGFINHTYTQARESNNSVQHLFTSKKKAIRKTTNGVMPQRILRPIHHTLGAYFKSKVVILPRRISTMNKN